MDPKDKWNRKHMDRLTGDESFVPNQRLVALSPYFKGGRALDLACGLGANSLYLGEISYRVEAYDVSEVAINHIRSKAEQLQLEVEPFMCDLTDLTLFDEKKSSFDLVVITYYLDRELFPVVKDLLVDDGYFFMETYYRAPGGSSGSVSERYKLDSQELLEVFGDFQVLFFEENEQEGRQTILARK